MKKGYSNVQQHQISVNLENFRVFGAKKLICPKNTLGIGHYSIRVLGQIQAKNNLFKVKNTIKWLILGGFR